MRSQSIEVGRTYKNGYGARVRIVAGNRQDSRGFTFVALIAPAADEGGDESVAAFDAEGRRLGFTSSPRSCLIIPDAYVRLADVLREINVTDMRASSRDELDAAICWLPTKEFTDV